MARTLPAREDNRIEAASQFAGQRLRNAATAEKRILPANPLSAMAADTRSTS
jgi:hypothetical protein